MTIAEAQRKLLAVQKKEAQLQEERNKLSVWLYFQGVNIYGSNKLEKRNQEIYKLYEKGVSTKELAEKFNLSTSRILSLHHHIKHRRNKKAELDKKG